MDIHGNTTSNTGVFLGDIDVSGDIIAKAEIQINPHTIIANDKYTFTGSKYTQANYKKLQILNGEAPHELVITDDPATYTINGQPLTESVFIGVTYVGGATIRLDFYKYSQSLLAQGLVIGRTSGVYQATNFQFGTSYGYGALIKVVNNSSVVVQSSFTNASYFAAGSGSFGTVITTTAGNTSVFKLPLVEPPNNGGGEITTDITTTGLIQFGTNTGAPKAASLELDTYYGDMKLKNALSLDGSINKITSGILNIGDGANSTAVSLGKVGGVIYIRGNVEMAGTTLLPDTITANELDTKTATPLLLGKATATSVEIGKTGATSTIKGNLTVDGVTTHTGDLILTEDIQLATGKEIRFNGSSSSWRMGTNLITVNSEFLTGDTIQFIATDTATSGFQFTNENGDRLLEVSGDGKIKACEFISDEGGCGYIFTNNSWGTYRDYKSFGGETLTGVCLQFIAGGTYAPNEGQGMQWASSDPSSAEVLHMELNTFNGNLLVHRGSIDVIGGVNGYKRTVVNASSYTILQTDDIIAVTYTATGACSVTLPEITNLTTFDKHKKYTIIDEGGNASTFNITINRGGSTDVINGATTQNINTNYAKLTLYNNGVDKWFII